MAIPTPLYAVQAGRPARRRASRWWLAGLLVGCLLPVGLGGGEPPRLAERIAQICMLAPALMRVRCRREARRRAGLHWLSVRPCRAGVAPPRAWPVARWTAALDTLTRRGPPPSE